MAAIFIAAILVVGTFAITTTVTPQSTAFAYMKKGPQDNKLMMIKPRSLNCKIESNLVHTPSSPLRY